MQRVTKSDADVNPLLVVPQKQSSRVMTDGSNIEATLLLRRTSRWRSLPRWNSLLAWTIFFSSESVITRRRPHQTHKVQASEIPFLVGAAARHRQSNGISLLSNIMPAKASPKKATPAKSRTVSKVFVQFGSTPLATGRLLSANGLSTARNTICLGSYRQTQTD